MSARQSAFPVEVRSRAQTPSHLTTARMVPFGSADGGCASILVNFVR
jgi:hypothetical protein